MLQFALAAVLVGYLPGAVLFRAPIGQRPKRAALRLEERLFWSVLLSVTWSTGVVFALAALDAYTFPRLLATNGVGLAAALALWRGRLRYAGGARPISASILLPIALVALGARLDFPGADYVMGGKDPGTYINEGAAIAQRGTLAIHDADVAAVPVEFRGLFFPPYVDVPYFSVRFMGFFVINPDRGTVMGQFPHWLPASIAIGDGLAGWPGMRATVGVWAILGLLAVYFAGADAFGLTAGALGAALLAVNVVEVWFARYPNSEVALQAMMFAAILAFRHAVRGSRGFFGASAAALVSLALVLRYDAIIGIAALAATATLIAVSRQRAGWTFGVVTTILSSLALWYLAVPMRPYSDWYLDFTVREGWWLLPAGVAGAAIFRRLARHDAFAAVIRRAVPPLFAASVAALAIYAYFFRVAHGTLAEPDAAALRTFAWYVGRAGLAAGLVATIWLALRGFWRAPGLFVVVAAFGVFFFYKMRIVPDHFWAARRFIAVAIPGLTMFVAAFAADVCDPARIARVLRAGPSSAPPGLLSRAAGAMLAAAAVLPLGVSFWTQTTPILSHVEYAGLDAHLASLAGRIGPRDLLVVESRRADSDLHVLALPLAYMYGRHVLVLDGVRPDKRMLEGFVRWAAAHYDRTLFLGAGGTDLLTRRITAEPIASERFQIPEYESAKNAYPTGVRRKEFDFGLYRLVAAGDRPPGPIDLTIGSLDDLNVVRFFAKEQHARTGELFRWTKNDAAIMLLGMAPDARTVTVWMSSGGRPRTAPPPVVTVAVAGRVVGTATPVDDVRPYTFDLPPDVVEEAARNLDPVPLTLNVSTWNPHDLLGAADTRNLGVMVTRAAVR